MARPRAFHDPDVLTRAMLVFWRHGFEACNVRELEKATGLTASSLYNRFGSKEGLFTEALDHYLVQVVDRRIRRWLQPPQPPVAGIRGFLETTYDYIDRDAGRQPMACLLSNTALAFGGRDAAVTARLVAGMDRVEDAFRAALERARRDGELHASADTQRLARHLVLGLQGLLVLSSIKDDAEYLRQSTDALLAVLPVTRPDLWQGDLP
jgi:AcrR family transcriptional regulator